MRAHENFIRRHLGPSDQDVASMLQVVGADSLQELIEQTVPEFDTIKNSLSLPAPMSEVETLETLQKRWQMRIKSGGLFLGWGTIVVIRQR